MTSRVPAVYFAAVLPLGVAVAAPAVYDFESLGTGPLFDQDGWVASSNTGITTGRGVNPTKILYAIHSSAANATRVNDAGFAFATIRRLSPRVVVGIDFRVATSTAPATLWFTLADHRNGYDSQLGKVGLGYTSASGQLHLFRPDGSSFGGDLSNFADHPGDWMRAEVRMNLAAAGGDGSWGVFVRNLTAGDADYSPVVSLQDLPMGLLTQFPDLDTEGWDRLDLAFTNVQVDNLSVDTACAGDFNGDSNADFFDYLDFVSAYDIESPAADFNQDGQVDFFDYIDFAAALDQGC